MLSERLMLPIYDKNWKRRIGIRLDRKLRAIDPVQEINSHLLPNDHPEARPLSLWPVISYRSLVWPFTPITGFRLLTMRSIAMSYIGVDLHTNSFTICRLSSDGEETLETYSLCKADLDKFCYSLSADDEVAVEATGNSAYFRDEVEPCVGRFVTVNPGQFQVDLLRKSGEQSLYLCSLIFKLHRAYIVQCRMSTFGIIKSINILSNHIFCFLSCCITCSPD